MHRIIVTLLPSATAVLRFHTLASTEQEISIRDLLAEESHSEKLAAEDIDCADETILRLAVAESFFTEPQEQCIERTTASAFEAGGWGQRAMEPEGGSGWGSGKTREEVEAKIVGRCLQSAGHGIALGPRLLRMTFHDAADFNNLMFANGSDAPATMGKVDSCLHTALLSVGLSQTEDDDEEEVAEGDPNHNRGLNNAIRWVLHMASESRASRPDIQVFGAIVAMEAWMDGPEMSPKYGRERGTCSKPVCSNENCWDALTPFFKAPVAEPVGQGMFCPMTNTLEPLRNLLNLTLDELVALQGAHSVGGIMVCTGLGNVAAGPYCPSKCGVPPGNFFDTGNLDGTAFDDTPGKLDNRYYQLLMDESYEGLPSCDEIKRSFPWLNKVGLGNAGDYSVGTGAGSSRDRSEQCQVGVEFEDENQCEVEACVEECASSTACQEAQDIDNDDTEAYLEGFESCNFCKKMCSGKYRRQLDQSAQKETFEQCRETCNSSADCVDAPNYNGTACSADCDVKREECVSLAGASGFIMEECMSSCRVARGTANTAKTDCRDECQSLPGPDRPDCRVACNGMPTGAAAFSECRTGCRTARTARDECRDVTWRPCRAECVENNAVMNCNGCRRGCVQQANTAMLEIDNRTGLEARPVRWCKRMTDVKECLDPSVELGINGGWGDCPENLRLTHPNTGQGRLSAVQNVERWTTFRGLHKRIMVLPSDWSYLGRRDTKALFKHYGTNEVAWKEKFVEAFTKVSEKGWAGQLHTCQAVECVGSPGNIVCDVAHDIGVGNSQNRQATARMQELRADRGLPPLVRPTSLVFPLAQCEPPLAQPPASCQLIGGFGLKAKLQCGDVLTYCWTAAATATDDRIKEEWQSGGKEPTCPDEDAAMLQLNQKKLKRARRHMRGASFIQSSIGLSRADGMLEEDFIESASFIQSSIGLSRADGMLEEDFIESDVVSLDNEESLHEEL